MRAFLRVIRIAAGLDVAANKTVRVLLEVAHILIGMLAAALIAAAAAWSYPRATDDIWLVAYACMAAVVVMGIGPVQRAWNDDRTPLTPDTKDAAHG